MLKSFHIVVFIAVLIIVGGCGEAMIDPAGLAETTQSSVVRLEQTSEGFTLLRNGKPYTILGVGGTTNLQLLKACGGNTVRTWDAEGIEPLMDEAHELGLSVVVGIWLEHRRHGYDHENPEHRKHDMDRVEKFVKQFRDHPALLAWGVGNELELGGEMDIAIKQINLASAKIKELDPNHPTMAVIAEIGMDKAVRIQNECPDIDMLGINSYGGMGSITERIATQGYTGAFAVTEFGPIGFWETESSAWGAPYEQTSAQKADFLRANYSSTITPNLGGQCLGSFAFLWGNKQEKTETWFGLLLPTGEKTETVDVLVEMWTGSPPKNRSPRVTALHIEEDVGNLAPGQQIAVRVDVVDADGDELQTQWRVIAESEERSVGGDRESSIDSESISVEQIDATNAKITVPQKPGAYRVFVTVRDGNNSAGTANVPILIVE